MSAAPSDEVQELLSALREDGETVLVPVRAHPGARRQGLQGVHAGALKISTTTAADRGKATDAIASVLARTLGVAPSRVSCARGATSRDKLFAVQGLDLPTARNALAEALQSDAP